MTPNSNPWDTLAKSSFNTQQKVDDIDPESADNILIAWPSIMNCILKQFSQPQGLLALDYGCGTGAFCRHLSQYGFFVVGLDTSSEMIGIAKTSTENKIDYLIGDHTKISPQTKFQVIVSIMTFQFIKNIDSVFESLTRSLDKMGLLIFTVFNPAWVSESLKNNIWFTDFDSIENPKLGWKTFQNMRIPVFIRDEEDYHDMASNCGLKKVLKEKPIFTSQFLEKYPNYFPNKVSEYLMLGYQKK